MLVKIPELWAVSLVDFSMSKSGKSLLFPVQLMMNSVDQKSKLYRFLYIIDLEIPPNMRRGIQSFVALSMGV